MATNDVVLLDGIVDERLAEELPSNERGEVFEFLCLEQFLKDYDLSRDEIESGWIDGRDDGGFDGLFIFINGHLLEDANDFLWPKSHASIDIWLITCKHHATFVQATLDAILATIQELFDLSRSNDQLHGSYSADLFEFRKSLETALRRLSIGRPTINVKVVYASRGDTSNVGASVSARADQIEAELTKLFSSSSARFQFVGACELVESYRKTKTFSLDLPFLEHLATGKDSYVLLVKLADYWKFVSDELGNLRRYLFDSNVRDYLGDNGVNDDISRSLEDETAPDFWWLNNGVTILATHATVPGKTIQLKDIQIVNGLQTTETVFRHFQRGSTVSLDRALLVKIIVSSDDQSRDRIIRATNNQSPVEVSALHATDKIQRDIEEILERHNWYYERRRNYYRNIGKPQSRFVTPLYLASAVIALIFKNISQATRLKSKFMRTKDGYESVFSSRVPIDVWPVLVNVFKSVDAGLSAMPASRKRGERFTRKWRPLVALIAVARRFKTFGYSVNQLLQTDGHGEITMNEVNEIWDVIMQADSKTEWNRKVKPPFVKTCCQEAAKAFDLARLEAVGHRSVMSRTARGLSSGRLPGEFVEQVNDLLPAQPWKPGTHLEIAQKLDCKASEVSAAIQQLIEEGSRNVQKDGVVYNSEGKVIAVDPDRASNEQ